jgi:hypothetical protein
MTKDRFNELYESVLEMGEVIRGEREPAKQTTIAYNKKSRAASKYIFAVCIQTDDEKLLVPRKIYQIKIRQEKYARVIDEEGEVAVYPLNFFLPLRLSKESQDILAKVA